MTTRLKIYNAALRICGEGKLASLTENREPRRLLDDVWDDGGVRACLEMGQWKFAMRGRMIDYDPNITPEFGYSRAFEKPSDWVVTSSLCSDEFFNSPLIQCVDEAGYWYADIDTIYVRYVSDDSAFGGDPSSWPSTFSDYVAAHFAEKIALKLTSDDKKLEKIVGWADRQLLRAKSKDAMADPPKFPAPGSWNLSRYGRRSRDRGNRGNLIG